MDSYAFLISTLEENSKEVFLDVSSVLLDIINNILYDKTNLSYRNLSLESESINKLLITPGGMECLFQIGFEEGSDVLSLPLHSSLCPLRVFRELLIETRDDYLRNDRRNNSKSENVNISSVEPEKQIQNAFLNNVEFHFFTALIYKKERALEKARKCVPIETIRAKALKAKKDMETSTANKDIVMDDLILYELLHWFKESFFKWVNNPECNFCGSETFFLKDDNHHETRNEIFKCNSCLGETTFTRYNDPEILLDTRRGRCGEWSNTFTLICCALGWDARLAKDETDHVWTEVYSESKQRWLHCDPCEAALDVPLTYEIGWKKKLTYVIAYSPYEVQDVTWRYSRNHFETLKRRRKCNENDLVKKIISLRDYRQKSFSASEAKYFNKRLLFELIEMMEEKNVTDKEFKERESGSIAWRISRGEASNSGKDMPHNKWSPIGTKNFIGVKYSSALDIYHQIDASGNVLKQVPNWKNGVFESTNIFKKVEHDWKKTYIARKEHSDTGRISWYFQSSDPEWVIEKVALKFSHDIYENGKVNICLQNDCLSVPIVLLDSKELTFTEFEGHEYVILESTLRGGKGNVAWQHVQLFRDDLNSSQFPFMYQYIKFLMMFNKFISLVMSKMIWTNN